MIKRSKIKYADFPACLAALSFSKWGFLFSSVACERSSQINSPSGFSFLAFLTTASFCFQLLSRHTITLGFASAWCWLIPPDLIDSSRLVRCLYWSDVCLRALRAKIRIWVFLLPIMTGNEKLRKENQSLRNEIAELKEKLQKISRKAGRREENVVRRC